MTTKYAPFADTTPLNMAIATAEVRDVVATVPPWEFADRFPGGSRGGVTMTYRGVDVLRVGPSPSGEGVHVRSSAHHDPSAWIEVLTRGHLRALLAAAVCHATRVRHLPDAYPG